MLGINLSMSNTIYIYIHIYIYVVCYIYDNRVCNISYGAYVDLKQKWLIQKKKEKESWINHTTIKYFKKCSTFA